MFGLGFSPNPMFPLGVLPETAAEFFSPREQAFMDRLFARTSEDEVTRKIQGLNDSIENLRLEDSVYAKLAINAVNQIKDLLDEEAARLDIEDPDGAPHTPLFGPKFPRDNREVPILGRILAVNGLQLTDSQAVFGDTYWESVAPDERLQNHELELLSGAAAGDIRQITDHVIFGAGAPYIVVNDATGIATDDRFRVREKLIPQDNLRKKDRSTDWVVTSAIRDAFTSASLGQLFAPVFGNAYWNDAKRRLKGRTISVLEGALPGDFLITAHNVGGGFITVEGTPAFAGTEKFAIVPLSPLVNGVQIRGTLRQGDPKDDLRYDTLEPATRLKLHFRNIGRVDGVQKDAIEGQQEAIDRFLHLRFHRWFGTSRRLKRQRKSSVFILQQFVQQGRLHDDIRQATIDLNLAVDIEDPPTTLPPTPSPEELA